MLSKELLGVGGGGEWGVPPPVLTCSHVGFPLHLAMAGQSILPLAGPISLECVKNHRLSFECFKLSQSSSIDTDFLWSPGANSRRTYIQHLCRI